jgi:DNA processing protein
MGASDIFARTAISPMLEMGAYEHLWTLPKQSFKKLSELFTAALDDLPSAQVDKASANNRYDEISKLLAKQRIIDFGFAVRGSSSYPEALRDAKYPIQGFYYRGDIGLTTAPLKVAVVGNREASSQGIKRAQKLSRLLVKDGVVVVSGMAKGIDTAAHQSAIDEGGHTIAVLGTPITHAYPNENAALQEEIATNHLLISQVPMLVYERRPPAINRMFFPERNITMSAITQATVIVEAGETSGSLIQAKAALDQGRKLFILDSCFERGLAWPEKMLLKGAFRVSAYEEIKEHLVIPS